MTADREIESALWNDWHVVCEVERLHRLGRIRTQLLGVPLAIEHDGEAPRVLAESRGPVPTRVKYGFVWACLGNPEHDIVTFPECDDPERWVVTAGSIGVAVSGLRAVENFLDLGHLGFVHAGYLGEQPHNEINTYKVAARQGGGVIATECKVYQPLASPVATEGFDVDYSYEVLRPFTVLLYKANPARPAFSDLIVLFVQPVTETSCIAHMLLVYLKDDVTAAAVRQFAQVIFSQDKPILENQVPKRLPLGHRAEIPVRADASSAAYRQYLRENDIRYGAIPAV